MQDAQHTAAVILAAGTSSRMGAEKNKLILPLAGHPVLAHVVKATLNSQARPVVLVLGHQAAEVRACIHSDLETGQLTVVENPDYHLGMSTSMQVGLRSLLSLSHDYKNDPTGVIFLLGDQPMISASIIDRLLAYREGTGKRIVLPLYQGQRGNPVVFSLELSDELMQVSGDEGGRSLLKRHPEEVAMLEMGELAANIDVDTWEAYLQVQAAWEQQTNNG
jgi:molybdenum cofactor cytidylyltransferase